MYIVEVLPITKSIRTESLSYFSSKQIQAGTIVSVELRKKLIKGIVLTSRAGSFDKSTIKSQSFALKRIRGISQQHMFQQHFLEAAAETAKYHCTSTGAVLASMIPTKLLQKSTKLDSPQQNISQKGLDETSEKYVIQDQFHDRYATYKSLIRASFAQKKSVIFICPTEESIGRAKQLLTKGIEEFSHTLKASMTTKKIISKWNECLAAKKPVLVITTGSFLALPRHDIGTIIIDQESSSTYKSRTRPYTDTRYVAESLASLLHAKFYLGDIALRAETLERFDRGIFVEEGSLKFRSLSQAKSIIVDMKAKDAHENNPFQLLGNDVIATLQKARENSDKTFIYVSRKGLAPTITCSDCGTIVTCNTCTAPMVLYGRDPQDEKNFFKCHICGEERSAAEKCTYCGSWRLAMLGIGVDTVVQFLEKEMPDLQLYVLDSSRAKTTEQAREISDAFYETTGGVLVGTEMALNYMRDQVEHVAVASIDALFSVPHYAMREKIIRTLLQLRSLATHTFHICTRKAGDPIFEQARQGNLADFYRHEFTERKKYNYPPFSTLIKVSVTGTPKASEKALEDVKALVAPQQITLYPSLSPKRNQIVWNGLMKIQDGLWPDEELRKKLMTLPPQYKIEVNPASLL